MNESVLPNGSHVFTDSGVTVHGRQQLAQIDMDFKYFAFRFDSGSYIGGYNDLQTGVREHGIISLQNRLDLPDSSDPVVIQMTHQSIWHKGFVLVPPRAMADIMETLHWIFVATFNDEGIPFTWRCESLTP